MKNQPTLGTHQTDSHQAEMEHYRTVVGQVEAYLAGLAPPLAGLARPHFESLVQGEFSQVAALLPYWLADLAPVSAETCRRLSVAQLFFWWYYHLQDELIDHDAAPSALLPGHLALLQAVDHFAALGLPQAPCWAEFRRLTQRCAEATAVEMQTRFTSLAELTPDRLSPFTLDFLIDRVAPFYFTTIAQLHLAGVPPTAPLHHDLPAALRCFAAARQLGDDASDWLADLRAGQLNYVSAGLMRRLYQQGLAHSGAELDPERLAGYQLRDETFWGEIEQTAQGLSHEALDHLAPHGPSRFAALIRHQLAQHAELWAAGRTQRVAWRETFGVEAV